MELIDISPTLHPGVAVWPGDVAFRRVVALSMAEGANLELSSITTTVHVGAHTDAPSHYVLGGPGIAERSLEFYYGPCQVIDAPGSGRIQPSEVGAVSAIRVLFRTGSFPDPDRFNPDFRSRIVRLRAIFGLRQNRFFPGNLEVPGATCRFTGIPHRERQVDQRGKFRIRYLRRAVAIGIDVQVTRLRRKIEPDPRVPQYLQTVRGRGYVLRPD